MKRESVIVGLLSHGIAFFFMSSVLAASLLLSSSSSSQTRREARSLSDTLAEVGGQAILARDLVDRIDLMPWAGKDNPTDLDSVKIKALQSLVAERILAMDAAARGLGNDSVFLRQVKNIEQLMVRDELYRQEVVPKVKVTEKEVAEGLRRFAWNISGLMAGTQSRQDADELQRALQATTNRDSTLHHPPTEFSITIDTIGVNFGLLERSQEDAVYSLNKTHPVSQPLEVPNMGWVVLVFLERKTNPEYEKRSIDERLRAVSQIIRRRKEAAEAERYAAGLLSRQRAEANRDTFDLFARTIYNILSSDSLAYKNNAGFRLDFIVDTAEAILKPYLKSILVETNGNAMTIEDVLEGYRAFQYLLPNLDRKEVWQRLNATVKDAAGREYLAREGYRKHLNNNEDVRHDVETWTTYWLSESLENQLLKDVGVSEVDVLDYLVSQAHDLGRAYQVNIREILSDSLSESVSMLEKISRGEDIATLAREFSRRHAWAARGGESGFFTVSQHPVIGFHALDSDTGRIVGPLRTPEGFSLFTVLAKKKAGGESTLPFDSLKAQIRRGLFVEKEQSELNRYVASAAKRFQVKLFYNHLKDVEVSPTNMVTKRFIGFGGTMMAVPGLYPLWDWVRNAADVKEVLP